MSGPITPVNAIRLPQDSAFGPHVRSGGRGTAGVIAALLIAACGSSSSSSTTSSSAASSGSGTSTAASGTSTTSGSATCDVAAINDQLAKYNGYPTYSDPVRPSTVSKLKGKKITISRSTARSSSSTSSIRTMKQIVTEQGIGFPDRDEPGPDNQLYRG